MNVTLPETSLTDASTGSKAKRQRRTAVAQAAAVAFHQMDLFVDDPIGATVALGIAEHAEAVVDAAIEQRPQLQAAIEAQPEARDNLVFARFVSETGASASELRETLAAAGADADVVMEQLAEVEELSDENLNDDLIDAELAEDVEGEVSDGELDSDDFQQKHGAAQGDSTSALALLLKRIRGARYEPPSLEQQAALAARIQQGDLAARNELVERNLRFLVVSAKRYLYLGRPVDQLVSAGMTGLIKAAETFDPTKARFTTHAFWGIRQAIQRSMQSDQLMRVPAHLVHKEAKLRREAAAAGNEAERERLSTAADSAARELKGRLASHVSLDGGSGDDSDDEGMHNMFASEAEGPEEAADKRRLVGKIIEVARSLEDDRASDIFMLRLGLHDDHLGEPQTLAQVADRYDISRERVRQIYAEAAQEVATHVMIWAKGADNLPPGFRKGLMNPGRV